MWPDARDAAVTLVATLTMVGLLAPLRDMPPGIVTLMLQIAAGGLAYGLFAFTFDLAGLRARALGLLRPSAA